MLQPEKATQGTIDTSRAWTTRTHIRYSPRRGRNIHRNQFEITESTTVWPLKMSLRRLNVILAQILELPSSELSYKIHIKHSQHQPHQVCPSFRIPCAVASLFSLRSSRPSPKHRSQSYGSTLSKQTAFLQYRKRFSEA
jgi:hypothetical protein